MGLARVLVCSFIKINYLARVYTLLGINTDSSRLARLHNIALLTQILKWGQNCVNNNDVPFPVTSVCNI